jgi:hypothetical protein
VALYGLITAFLFTIIRAAGLWREQLDRLPQIRMDLERSGRQWSTGIGRPMRWLEGTMTIRTRTTLLLLFGIAMLAGCASTKVTQETPIEDLGLARPNTIYVYDFIATQQDIPSDAPILSSLKRSIEPASDEEVNTGRQLGALIAKELAADINAMGLKAVQAGPGSSPRVRDMVIRGYIVSAESGSMGKRFVIGFGSGASEMDTVVEGFVMTKHGLRKLGSGQVGAEGNKAPGLVVPAAVAIATGNPIGLAVMGGLKVYGQASGRNSLEGRAKSTADVIAEQLKARFKVRGWIS